MELWSNGVRVMHHSSTPLLHRAFACPINQSDSVLAFDQLTSEVRS